MQCYGRALFSLTTPGLAATRNGLDFWWIAERFTLVKDLRHPPTRSLSCDRTTRKATRRGTISIGAVFPLSPGTDVVLTQTLSSHSDTGVDWRLGRC